MLDDDAVEFGQIYRSAGIALRDSADLPDAQLPDAWVGQPGMRAPHLVVEVGDHKLSTLELFGKQWVLLSCVGVWAEALANILRNPDLDVIAVQLDSEEFLLKYGLSQEGCSIVRPDGYVAWRCSTLADAPEEALREALATVFVL